MANEPRADLNDDGLQAAAARGAEDHQRYLLEQDHDSLDRAIDGYRTVVLRRPQWNHHLASCLIERYDRTGEIDDLEEALTAARRAAALDAVADPDQYIELMIELSGMLRRRHERLGRIADLDEAITVGRQAVARAREGDPDLLAVAADYLAEVLRTMYQATGAPDILNEAVELDELALEVASADHPDLVGLMHNLAIGRLLRYMRDGSQQDIDAAISLLGSIAESEHRDLYQLSLGLSNLVTALSKRFEKTSHRNDIDAAVDAGRRSSVVLPPDHPGTIFVQTNVSSVLMRRFYLFGSIADLNEAIGRLREAVALASNHTGRFLILANLCSALRSRFGELGDVTDLYESVECARASASGVEIQYWLRDTFAANLSLSLLELFRSTGLQDHLDEAIGYSRAALSSGPVDPIARARLLGVLCRTLTDRFELSADRADIDEAIAIGKEAHRQSLDHDDSRVSTSFNLASALRARHRMFADSTDGREAISLYQSTAESLGASSQERISAAVRWADTVAEIGDDPGQALAGYRTAVELLPVHAWRGIGSSDRERALADWSGVAADAAASAVSGGRSEEAVQLLEQGRSVIWSDWLSMHTELIPIRAHNYSLAARMDEVRAVLHQDSMQIGQLQVEEAESL